MKINFKTISCMFLASVLSILPLQAEVITINGNGVDVPTIVHNNRKHIPLRIVANQLDLNVAFDNSTKTITIKDTQNIMVMKIGSKMYTMNDITYEMDTMPLVQEGVTYLPLRVLGESFCTEFTFIDNHITLVREPSVVDTIVPKKAYVFRDTSYDFAVEVLNSYPIVQKAISKVMGTLYAINFTEKNDITFDTRGEKYINGVTNARVSLKETVAYLETLQAKSDVTMATIQALEDCITSLDQVAVAYLEEDYERYLTSVATYIVLTSFAQRGILKYYQINFNSILPDLGIAEY